MSTTSDSNVTPSVEDRLSETIAKAISYATRRGSTVLATKPYSNHPDDHYFCVVLHRNVQGDYVVHTFNSQFEGLDNGDYNDSLGNALRDFQRRGRIHDL